MLYDSKGKLISHTSPGGRTIKYEYDSNGRVSYTKKDSVDRPMSGKKRHQYNTKGDCIYEKESEFFNRTLPPPVSTLVECIFEYLYHENGGKTKIQWFFYERRW